MNIYLNLLSTQKLKSLFSWNSLGGRQYLPGHLACQLAKSCYLAETKEPVGSVAGQPAGSFVTQEVGGGRGMASPKLSRLLSSQLLTARDEAQSRSSGTSLPRGGGSEPPQSPRSRLWSDGGDWA